MVSGTDVHFDVTAAHATRFTYLHQPPGSPVFVVALADSEQTSLTLHGLAPGQHGFKAFGSNSDGRGPDSAVTLVTVAQSAVA
jgi:hypothetical protein